MERHLHIIDFTVPYPADYGGVIDLFYKLPALQAVGVHIHLHCFDYGRGPQKALEAYCASVHYYTRSKKFSLKLPYIVSSRMNEALCQRLLQDEHPILMEGVHTSFLLHDKRFAHRKKYLRLHNVEHEYYGHLADAATNWIKKLYYKRESKLLKLYEASIAHKADYYWTVTQKDADRFQQLFQYQPMAHLPLYLPADWGTHTHTQQNGCYCLYQADLSVDANEKAAIWLLEEVFKHTDLPLVIAGKNPSEKLQTLAHAHQNTCIVANPKPSEMDDMIRKAHINVLPSFSNAGIKLKLLHALYNGKHCVVNSHTVDGSGVAHLCHVVNDAAETRAIIQQLFQVPFSTETDMERKTILNKLFNHHKNVRQQIEVFWGKEAVVKMCGNEMLA